MAVSTSSLKHMDEKQSFMNQNEGERGAMLRAMLPNLLINAGVPFAVNLVAQNYMSAVDALLLASSVPALYTLGTLAWKRRIDMLGATVVAGLLLSAAFALLLNSPRLLLLQHSAVSGLFGIVMLLSLLLPRPVMFYLIRSIRTQNDPQRIAAFNANWEFPQVRSFYRILNAVWGCVTLAQVVITAFLSLTLPIPMMLAISPFLSFAFILPAAHWSMAYFRKNRPMFDQLRQQREAAAA